MKQKYLKLQLFLWEYVWNTLLMEMEIHPISLFSTSVEIFNLQTG